MSLSSLGFGILLVINLQAALAQSAPYISSYSDEEALLDKLAQQIAARGSNLPFDLQFPPSSLDYSDVLSVGNIGKNSPGLENLGPRQFAYKPDDIRFYFPTAAQFPQNNNNINSQNPSEGHNKHSNGNNRYLQQQEQQQQQQQQQQRLTDGRDLLMNEDEDVERESREDFYNSMQPNQFSAQDIIEGLRKQQDKYQSQKLDQNSQKLDEAAFHYMKKSQPETIEDGGGPYFKKNSRSNSKSDVSSDTAGGDSPTNNDNNNNANSHPYEPDHNSPQNPSYASASKHDANTPNVIASPLGNSNSNSWQISSFYYIAVIAGCTAAVVVGVIGAGICWYRIHERVKAAADVDYPAYGVTGPSKDVSPSGGDRDRKLAQSAHFYNYQHQKQQMQALAKNSGDRQGSGGSDVESEASDNEDGDYTVYECPGLAGLCNTGDEMEVKNPLYADEPTPATPHVVPSPNVESNILDSQPPSNK